MSTHEEFIEGQRVEWKNFGKNRPASLPKDTFGHGQFVVVEVIPADEHSTLHPQAVLLGKQTRDGKSLLFNLFTKKWEPAEQVTGNTRTMSFIAGGFLEMPAGNLKLSF